MPRIKKSKLCFCCRKCFPKTKLFHSKFGPVCEDCFDDRFKGNSKMRVVSMSIILPLCKFSRMSFWPFIFADGFSVLICFQCHEALSNGQKPKIKKPDGPVEIIPQDQVMLEPKVITEKKVVSDDDLNSAVKQIVEKDKELVNNEI